MANVDVYIACSGAAGQRNAAEIAQRLRNVYVSSRVSGQDQNRAEDQAALDRCRVFLFLCDSVSTRDRSLLAAVEKVGNRRDVSIIVFRLDNRALSDSAMFYLSKHRWIDGTIGDSMERVEELVEVVAQSVVDRWPSPVGMDTKQGPFVFISYSHRDPQRLADLCAILDANRIRYWYDKDIRLGRKWDKDVADHVCAARCFLALVSREYLLSEVCKDELMFARGRNKSMAIIKLDGSRLPEEIDMRCGRIQRTDGWKLNFPGTLMQELMTLDGFRVCQK